MGAAPSPHCAPAAVALPEVAKRKRDEKLAVYAHAGRGLIELEPHPEKHLKYADFIDIYAAFDENERQLYSQRYPREAAEMSGFAQRFIEQGVQRGEARILRSQLRLRFGELPDVGQQRLETADADTLLCWSTRVLTAKTLDEVLGDAT